MAAGLPVVSSPLPEVDAYAPEVRTAVGVDGWITALEAAVKDRSLEADQRRSEMVSDEDWSVRVRSIVEAVSRACPNVEWDVPAVEASLSTF